MDSYDLYVLGPGNPLHPDNNNQEDSERTIDDVLDELNEEDRDIVLYRELDFSREFNDKMVRIKNKIETEVKSLKELHEYFVITENTYVQLRLNKIIQNLMLI